MTKQQEIVMIIVNKRANVLNKKKERKKFANDDILFEIQKCTKKIKYDKYIYI
jgi:hypothetical protein